MGKTSIAVVGAKGYVGQALCQALEKNPGFSVIRVIRENYAAMKAGSYDTLINAAMPSKRFWAKNNPQEDFKETVQKTTELYTQWKYKKFIQISTVSARCEPESVYGKHKAAAEKIIGLKDHLIIRLSVMFSPQLSKGALVDILQGQKVFVSGESRYPYASLDFVTSWIAQHLNEKGIVELGARNTVTLQEIADRLGQKVEFSGPVEDQTLQTSRPEFPDAAEVFDFMAQMKRKNIMGPGPTNLGAGSAKIC